jgi:uncharacterized protein YbjT (DUF2867 family)
LRILVTGATGLIGSAVVARLLAARHEVIGLARNVGTARRTMPEGRWVAIDIGAAISPEAWMPVLAGVEAVVNCAGALQDGPADSVAGVHALGAAALFAACQRAGVRRIVHISAIGVDRETPTAFSLTKRQGEAALMSHDLDWVILRPSIVIGRAAFGGSALFRGLATLPVLPVIAGTGPLQTVQRDDLVAAVLFFLREDAPSRIALDVTAPPDLTFTQIVAHHRRWLGRPEALLLPMPGWPAAVMFRLGDAAGRLGWRPPVRSTAIGEIQRGATGDSTSWADITGIRPRGLAEALAAEPASVQERWFARLYLLKPLVFAVFSVFWIATGLICLGPGYQEGAALMRDIGAGALAGPIVIAGALADICIGVAIAWRRTARAGLCAALMLSLLYLAAGTLLQPELWLDPLGRLLKVLPILVLNLVALAIIEDR